MPSNCSRGVQKVFDKMASKKKVFMGGVSDTEEYDHVTVTSTIVFSSAAKNIALGNDEMLRDLLRVRYHCIGKVSVKRLKHIKHDVPSAPGSEDEDYGDSNCICTWTEVYWLLFTYHHEPMQSKLSWVFLIYNLVLHSWTSDICM